MKMPIHAGQGLMISLLHQIGRLFLFDFRHQCVAVQESSFTKGITGWLNYFYIGRDKVTLLKQGRGKVSVKVGRRPYSNCFSAYKHILVWKLNKDRAVDLSI